MFMSRYRSPDEIIAEEIKDEITRIPQVNSNPLLRHKLAYWKKKQGEERNRIKIGKSRQKVRDKELEKESRKIKSKHGVSKYTVECSNCGQGFRTKKELAAHIAHYKKTKDKWGSTCSYINTTKYKLDSVRYGKKCNEESGESGESTGENTIRDIDNILNMIKDRMKLLTNRCEKCRNTFSSAAIKKMSCKYKHNLCVDCHKGESTCTFCAIHFKVSHASDHELAKADKIRVASTRFKPQTQIQIQHHPEPKVTYKPIKPKISEPEEHPNYCNICFDVCSSSLFQLDCGGHHAMCLSCTNEIVRQSYGPPNCPFCRRKFTAPR